MSNLSALFAWQIQMAFMLVLCQSLGTPPFTENNWEPRFWNGIDKCWQQGTVADMLSTGWTLSATLLQVPN